MNPILRIVLAFLVSLAIVIGLWYGYKVPYPQGLDRYALWFTVSLFSLTAIFGSLEISRRNALRLAGVFTLLGVLLTVLALKTDNAFDKSNVFEVLSRQGALGILGVGAALVIITGGIDLSIGSVVGLAAVAFGVLMEKGYHPYTAATMVIGLGVIIGTINGLLVTQLRLQAFLVTLCGMFVFRGLSREMTSKQTGLVQAREVYQRMELPDYKNALQTLRTLVVGKDETGALEFPAQLVVMLAIVGVVALLLHRSAYGRYWFAIGYNDQAARYAGVNVKQQRCFVFIACSTMAAIGGILWLLYSGSADPASAGNMLELYAITAAVLGGVSLKGGEGTALGLALGALVQPVINNLMVFLEIRSSAEPWVIGLILLIGTIVDEIIRRRSKADKS